MQGTVLATYKLALKDRAAMFLGKKDAEEDGLLRSLKSISKLKS